MATRACFFGHYVGEGGKVHGVADMVLWTTYEKVEGIRSGRYMILMLFSEDFRMRVFLLHRVFVVLGYVVGE
jgi:hypothetical protein